MVTLVEVPLLCCLGDEDLMREKGRKGKSPLRIVGKSQKKEKKEKKGEIAEYEYESFSVISGGHEK